MRCAGGEQRWQCSATNASSSGALRAASGGGTAGRWGTEAAADAPGAWLFVHADDMQALQVALPKRRLTAGAAPASVHRAPLSGRGGRCCVSL